MGASAGCRKTVCAELPILRLFSSEKLKENPDPKCVYVTPKRELAEIVRQDWDKRFSTIDRNVVILTGETAIDLKLIAKVIKFQFYFYDFCLSFATCATNSPTRSFFIFYIKN